VGEKCSDKFRLEFDLHVILEIFYMQQICDMGRLYFSSEGRCVEDFFALKNPTASARFKPANLGTKGQHATSRPSKPIIALSRLVFLCRCYYRHAARSRQHSTYGAGINLLYTPLRECLSTFLHYRRMTSDLRDRNNVTVHCACAQLPSCPAYILHYAPSRGL
jgi:hypothetical protein